MTTGLTCPACGRANRDGLRFCTACGQPLAPARASAEGVQGVLPLAVTESVLAPTTGTRAAPSPAPAPPRRAPSNTTAYPPILGPVDRVTFESEQARRRRRTWVLSAVCGLAALLTGLPASLVFAPVVLTVILVATKLLEVSVGIPAGTWDLYERALFPFVRALDQLSDESPTDPSLLTFVQGALAWVLPGMGAMLLIWPALRALFMRGGAVGVLLALGARPPRMDDLEERQLVNVVEEMALAAGLPPPTVMLLDSSIANAAAIGSKPDDAIVLVSRRLLDDLDRDETQGVLADVIASIGNGDLRIALSIMAVYQTYGFTYALLKAPFSPRARATLWRMTRWLLGFWGRRDREAEAETVARMLARGAWDLGEDKDDFDRGLATPPNAPQPGVIRFWGLAPVIFIGLIAYVIFTQTPIPFEVIVGAPVAYLLILVLADLRYVIYAGGRAVVLTILCISLPYYLGTFMSQFLLYFLAWLVLGPLLALVWRTRRYLADATAVQLTRHPTAVADGLLGLQRSGGLFPGGRWAAALFVVGQVAGGERASARMAQWTEEDRKAAAAALRGLWSGDPAAAQQLSERMSKLKAEMPDQDKDDVGSAGEPSSLLSLNPPLDKRLARLRAMGADVDPAVGRRRWPGIRAALSGRSGALGLLVALLLALLVPVMAGLLLVAMAIMALFTLGCGALMMAVVYALLQLMK